MFNFVNNLRSEISRLFFSKTLRNTGVVFAGSIIASIFSLITILILSRTLGPAVYGVFSLVGSVVLLLISFTDFGISTALSKFIAPLEDKFTKRATSFFRSVFWIKALLGLTTVLLGLIFLYPISLWLGGSYLEGPLVIGFIIAGVLSFYAYIPAALQALQKFWVISLMTVFSNLLKLLLIIILLSIGYLTLWNALYVNLFIALIVLLIGSLILPRFFISRIDWAEDLKSMRALFSFTKWLAISYIFNAIAARLDILLLSHFKSVEEVGYYALAFQLSSVFPLLLGAASTVLIPKVSALKTQDQLEAYILKIIKISFFIFPLTLIGVVLVPSVINALFGLKYISSIPMLQILLLNYSLVLIINPVSYVLYTLNKQNLLSIMNVVTLVTLFIMQIYLIPKFGGTGAALSLLFNTIIAISIITALLLWFLKQEKKAI